MTNCIKPLTVGLKCSHGRYQEVFLSYLKWFVTVWRQFTELCKFSFLALGVIVPAPHGIAVSLKLSKPGSLTAAKSVLVSLFEGRLGSVLSLILVITRSSAVEATAS